jgi:hypothetical protein
VITATIIRVPDSLAELDQWIVWRYEKHDDGKPRKVPYQINGNLASSTDPKTWRSFDEALRTWQQDPRRWSGIGFVFSADDPFCGIDLDNCLEDTDDLAIKPWARSIIETFSDCYIEISPGGHGLHIFCKATLPGNGKKVAVEDGAVEMYDRGRYFTVTGRAYADDLGNGVEDHQKDVEELYRRLSGDRPGPKADLYNTPNVAKGDRHDYLVSVAAQYAAKGMDHTEILAALKAVNARRCVPPKTDDELVKIVEWACQKSSGGDRPGQPEPMQSWPSLAPEALHGLPGDIVRVLEPHSEADPVALLAHVLVAFGNLIGRGPHFSVGGTAHHTNLSTVLVGATASRKGSAKDDSFFIIRTADAGWFDSRVQSGLSSGEGLVWAVRDPIEEQQAIREKGRVIDYEMVTTDPGVADKRLLLIEAEFGSTLRVMEREGNTLSAQIRQAWDSGNLRLLTKTRAARATGAHVSIIGHVTRDELLKYITATEQANGFANRILWILVRRSKYLPDGGELQKLDLGSITSRLRSVVDFARSVGEIRRSEPARELWHAVYPDLAGDRFGLFGAVTSRAEAQTMRLACIYALMSSSAIVEPEHLAAALAVWSYAEASARFVFGGSLGDATADAILKGLRASEDGLDRTDLSNLFGRNKPASEIQRGLMLLQQHGLVRSEKTEGSTGRPSERWFAVCRGTK